MRELSAVRSRLKTVGGIRSVCSTLATVAAAKLSRTRDQAIGSRIYTERLREMVGRQLLAASAAGVDPATLSPLLACREVRRVLLLVVGADQGLCGGYNISLDAEVRRALAKWNAAGISARAIVRGDRTARILKRIEGLEIAEVSSWPRAGVTDDDVDHIFETGREALAKGDADEVWAVFTAFFSSVQRMPRTVRLLPIDVPAAASAPHVTYCYEPERDTIVRELLDSLARLQVEDALLEAFAAEQSARMITMQEATERADTSLAELRVRFNRLRRESITADLTGILVARRIRTEVADAS